MNAIIDELGRRFETLVGGVRFRTDFDQALDSPEQLLAIGLHNRREYEKIKAMDEEHQERIENLVANMLASALQEEAIARYGNTDGSSIRQVLYGWFNRPEDRLFEDRLRQTAKIALLGINLTEEQSDAIMKGMYDILPQLIIEVIEELIAPWRLLPCAETQSIAMALTDMMKEAQSADVTRHN